MRCNSAPSPPQALEAQSRSGGQRQHDLVTGCAMLEIMGRPLAKSAMLEAHLRLPEVYSNRESQERTTVPWPHQSGEAGSRRGGPPLRVCHGLPAAGSYASGDVPPSLLAERISTMETPFLRDKSHTAVLIMDYQNDIVTGMAAHHPEILDRAAAVPGGARLA